jgi:hypothetical protein
MALAAGVYDIPVYSEDSVPNGSNDVVEAEPTSPLDIARLEIDNALPESPTVTRPIPFPSNEDIASVHG